MEVKAMYCCVWSPENENKAFERNYSGTSEEINEEITKLFSELITEYKFVEVFKEEI